MEKTLSDQDRLLGTVTENSDGNNIWKLRYTFETAYIRQPDGAGADQGRHVGHGKRERQQAVSIEPPMVFDAPVQDFLCSHRYPTSCRLTSPFPWWTSQSVSSVRVVNDYGDEIAKLTINSAGMNMTETDDTRVWTLEGMISEPYTGSLYVGYELIVGEGFTQSDYREDVEFTAAATAETTLPRRYDGHPGLDNAADNPADGYPHVGNPP